MIKKMPFQNDFLSIVSRHGDDYYRKIPYDFTDNIKFRIMLLYVVCYTFPIEGF